MASLSNPSGSFGRLSKRPEEVLLLCYYDPNGISTVSETVAYLQLESVFSVSVLNLFEHRQDSGNLALSGQVNLAKYSVLLIHNTVSYNVDNLRSLDKFLPITFDKFEGVKVLFKQDENFRFAELDQYINDIGFDIVYTCLPSDALPKIYPKSISACKFIRMLTGYVTPALRSLNSALEGRPIDIGYRGSIQPLSFGRLAYEKRKIGDDIQSLLANKGIKLDISSRWEDRKGGAEWFDFLASCKATLGAESGASVFDLYGNLQERCRKAEKSLGPFREDHLYAESYLAHLKDLEGVINYNQISPRHFEATATRTLQLLYPGSYSEILEAGKHYFPLKRDYSNLGEALDILLDDTRRSEIVNRAYDEVLLKQDYWIETFVASVDHEIALALEKKNKVIKSTFSIASESMNVLLLASHEPRLDPRLDWIANHAPASIRIHQCGVLPRNDNRVIREVVATTQALYQASGRKKYECGMWREWLRLSNDKAGRIAAEEVLFLEQVINLPDNEFAEFFAASIESERLVHFRWYLEYFLDISASLVTACLGMRGIQGIIATDLDTLLPALILKSIFRVPLIFDSHEYWPDSDSNSHEFEQRYWVSLEEKLVSLVDYRQVVSPGLAELMSVQYQCNFAVLPNVEPYSGKEEDLNVRQEDIHPECKFLFQGGFAVGRGLERLIEIWPKTDERAILILRGRDNEFKMRLIELANGTGLLDTRIFFPAAVDESELISCATQADVGLVPYPPIGNNYKHCSPNKLSQYMAAGLPVLADNTSFVREVVATARCGIVVDFKQEEKLIDAINTLTENRELRLNFANAGCEYRRSAFNWQRLSKSFYDTLSELVFKTPEPLSIYEVDQGHYYFPKTLTSLDAGARILSTAVLGKNPYSKRAEAIKTYFRPLWKKLPESLRTRINNVIYRK